MVMAMVMEKMVHMDIMQKNNIIVRYLLTLVVCALSACSLKNVVSPSSTLTKAESLFSQGAYAEALPLYERTLDAVGDSASFCHAAVSYAAVGQYEKSIEIAGRYDVGFDSLLSANLKSVVDSMSQKNEYLNLVVNNRKLFSSQFDNKQLTDDIALAYCANKDRRLSDCYSAVSKDVRSKVFPVYFSFASKDKDDAELLKMCKEALSDNPDQVVALKYIGVSRYNSAEAEYKKVMAEYNKNKNATTYAYLRRDLKKISTVYVDSRTYLEKVRAIDSADIQVVKYLINIYNRLDQPAKAKSLQKLLQ